MKSHIRPCWDGAQTLPQHKTQRKLSEAKQPKTNHTNEKATQTTNKKEAAGRQRERTGKQITTDRERDSEAGRVSNKIGSRTSTSHKRIVAVQHEVSACLNSPPLIYAPREAKGVRVEVQYIDPPTIHSTSKGPPYIHFHDFRQIKSS